MPTKGMRNEAMRNESPVRASADTTGRTIMGALSRRLTSGLTIGAVALSLAPVGARSEFHNFTFPLCVLCAP